MNKESIWSSAILGIAIGLGVALAGLSIGSALYQLKASQRYVTVKGLAEKTVRADLAIWPISFQTVGNELVPVQNRMESNRNNTVAFLKKLGFDDQEISFSAPLIRDTGTEVAYGGKAPKYQYVAQTSVVVRSDKIDLVKSGAEKLGALIHQGIILMPANWENKTSYSFTKLNDIKPDMIRQATLNAREAASQFAKDSGSKVGAIRNASQGYFTIEDRDANSPDWKKIRVVTTIEYFLRK